jgi:hypothetical protein
VEIRIPVDRLCMFVCSHGVIELVLGVDRCAVLSLWFWRYAWRTAEEPVAGRVDSPEKPRINYAFFFVLDFTPYHIPTYLPNFSPYLLAEEEDVWSYSSRPLSVRYLMTCCAELTGSQTNLQQMYV